MACDINRHRSAAQLLRNRLPLDFGPQSHCSPNHRCCYLRSSLLVWQATLISFRWTGIPRARREIKSSYVLLALVKNDWWFCVLGWNERTPLFWKSSSDTHQQWRTYIVVTLSRVLFLHRQRVLQIRYPTRATRWMAARDQPCCGWAMAHEFGPAGTCTQGTPVWLSTTRCLLSKKKKKNSTKTHLQLSRTWTCAADVGVTRPSSFDNCNPAKFQDDPITQNIFSTDWTKYCL